MKMNSSLVLAAIACSLFAGSALARDNFRCGSRIVRVGATQAGVLDACGQPDSKAVEKVPVRSAKHVVGERGPSLDLHDQRQDSRPHLRPGQAPVHRINRRLHRRDFRTTPSGP
jgi:hypothetical protein